MLHRRSSDRFRLRQWHPHKFLAEEIYLRRRRLRGRRRLRPHRRQLR